MNKSYNSIYRPERLNGVEQCYFLLNFRSCHIPTPSLKAPDHSAHNCSGLHSDFTSLRANHSPFTEKNKTVSGVGDKLEWDRVEGDTPAFDKKTLCAVHNPESSHLCSSLAYAALACSGVDLALDTQYICI